MDAVARLEAELTRTLAGLRVAETAWTPAEHPAKWSVQQVVEHLDLTYRSTCELLRLRLEKKTPTLTRPTVGQRAAQIFVTRLGYFPRGRVAPESVSPTTPCVLRSGAELAEQVRARLHEMSGLLEQGEQLFGPARAASHFVLGPLSMAQWGEFHLAHGRHHLRQIRAILRSHGLRRAG